MKRKIKNRSGNGITDWLLFLFSHLENSLQTLTELEKHVDLDP